MRYATFASGDVVAGRYEVLRLIAHGGMGEVYEVEDRELRTRVALKTIRSDRVSDAMLERFRRELFLARRVTHPNVCRLYDLGRDGDTWFLTMELLAGVTLAERLARAGRLSTADALPFARQIASALDAAHRAGVVHRDLKPGNVMLVRDGLRAMVTDFGIAHAAEDPFGHVSRVGELVGSPDYMAPEQLACDPITPAADIFAFGILLYEMVTGARPFERGASRAKPTPPRVHVPELDPRWSAAILRCLSIATDARFATAGQVVAALEARRARTAMPVAALALVAVAGASSWHFTHKALADAPRPGARRSVAVVGFKNLSARSDTAWLSSAVGETLTVDLAAGERLRTISGEEVAHARNDLALDEADGYSPDTLRRLHELTGADVVVVGSFLALGADKREALQLNVRVQDAATGATLAQISDAATIDGVAELVHREGERVRSALGVDRASQLDEQAARAALPVGSEALRAYSAGVAKLRVFDAPAARELFRHAAELEPANPLIHAQLAEVWLTLGYDREATAEIERATALGGGLPPVERRTIEARAHEIARQWDQAIAGYRALATERPDVVEHTLRLATAQVEANRGTDALATLAELRLDQRGKDPRIDLAEAAAAEATGDFLREQAAALRASEAASRLGARLLVGHAALALARARYFQGKCEEALASAREAERIFALSGDANHQARARATEATLMADLGDVAEAERIDQDVLEVRRGMGDRKNVARLLINLGLIVENRGELARARRLSLEALDHARAIDDRWIEALAQVRLSAIAAVEGDPVAAAAHADEALAARPPDDLRNYYLALECRGASAAMMGRLDDARALLEQAISVARRVGAIADAEDDLVFIASTRIDADDLAGAHRALADADAANDEHRPDSLAWRVTVTARLALAEHHPEQAEHDASIAYDRLLELGRPVAAIEPATTAARAWLARGEIAKAREIVDHVAGLGLEGGLPRLTIALLRAEIAAASRSPRARKMLVDVRDRPARPSSRSSSATRAATWPGWRADRWRAAPVRRWAPPDPRPSSIELPRGWPGWDRSARS